MESRTIIGEPLVVSVRRTLGNYRRTINRRRYNLWLKKEIKRLLNAGKPLKIILGASDTLFEGWLSTNIYNLDITKEEDWKKLFQPESISNILAEHVFEHLTIEEGRRAINCCLRYLKDGGIIRLAVPDANHPSEYYRDYAKPMGHGAGAEDHKVFFDYKLVQELLEDQGSVRIEFLEYFDEYNNLHEKPLTDLNGYVSRSIRRERETPDSDFRFSSLIVDIIKEREN